VAAVKIKVVSDKKAMQRFHSALVALSRMQGKDFETTIRAEIRAILNNAIRNTPKAKVEKITERVMNKWFITADGVTYKTGHKYPDSIWSSIKEARNRSIARRKKARGLAASAWVRVAERLRIPVQAAGYIKGAKSGRIDVGSMVMVSESGSGSKYQIGFIQALTKMNVALDLGAVFNRALTDRANYFSRSMKLLAKGKVKSLLDRYPGIGRVS